MNVYEIANWEQNFENNRTREMKSMAWVPVPNKMDGDGYTELLDHHRGPLHYAAWMGLVLIASRCGERGTLLRSTGEAHDSASLARMSRIPAEVFDEAIPRLLKLGWLLCKSLPDKESQLPAEIPQEGAPAPHPTDEGTERNGTEGKGTGDTPQPPDDSEAAFIAARDRFTAAWNAAPGVRSVTVMSGRRVAMFRKRLTEQVLIGADRVPWLDGLERMLREKFPLRCTRGSPSNWMPDVDWILDETALPAIIEGKYDWEKTDGRQRTIGPGQRYDPTTATRAPSLGGF